LLSTTAVFGWAAAPLDQAAVPFGNPQVGAVAPFGLVGFREPGEHQRDLRLGSGGSCLPDEGLVGDVSGGCEGIVAVAGQGRIRAVAFAEHYLCRRAGELPDAVQAFSTR
jgi:hypothetical protein